MGALDGIKVIDAGLLVQGPQAAATMREWGAEVIKVELPGVGDQARWLPARDGDMRSGYFIACNRGKRSVTVDLRVPDGREVFLRLAEQADVIITNFAPGTMESWGLGYDDVAVRNPRIIYAEGSTFGTEGSWASREGADLSAQAAGGLIANTGCGDDRTPVAATIADHIASQNILSGVLAALFARERTGVGQRVTTSLVGGQIWAQASEYTTAMFSQQPMGATRHSHPLIAGLYGIFPTADGWVAVVGIVGPQRETFFNVVGHPELHERFSQFYYFEEHKAELFPILDKAFAKATTAEWCARLAAAGLRHAPVRDHLEVLADPDSWANGWFATVDGEDVVAVPITFSATPGAAPALAPELGQHTEEVLLELGYGWDEIGSLGDKGAI